MHSELFRVRVLIIFEMMIFDFAAIFRKLYINSHALAQVSVT